MPNRPEQKVFPFYQDYRLLKQLVLDLSPHIERLTEQTCQDVLYGVQLHAQVLEAAIVRLEEKLDGHLRYHREDLDQADWWKHGGDPS